MGKLGILPHQLFPKSSILESHPIALVVAACKCETPPGQQTRSWSKTDAVPGRQEIDHSGSQQTSPINAKTGPPSDKSCHQHVWILITFISFPENLGLHSCKMQKKTKFRAEHAKSMILHAATTSAIGFDWCPNGLTPPSKNRANSSVTECGVVLFFHNGHSVRSLRVERKSNSPSLTGLAADRGHEPTSGWYGV